jgi:hypothetical protein
MPKRRIAKQGGRSSKRARIEPSMRLIHPPQIRSNPQMRHKYRFSVGSAGTYVITNSDVLLACGTICTVTNSTVAAIFSSFRIRSIEVWGGFVGSSTANSPVTVACNWNGAPVFVANAEVSDTSVSAAYPAHIVARPPKNTNASFWQTASTNSLFDLVVPTNAMIDLEVDLIMSDNQDALVQTGLATATLGTEYFLALDGPSSNELVPVSLNTTH